MPFEFTEPEKLSLPKRKAIRRAVQARLVQLAARQAGATTGVLVVRPDGGWDVQLKGGGRAPLPERESNLLKAAIEWEKTGTGPAPSIPY